MRSFAPILRVALASFLAGTAFGDSNPEMVPVPVDAIPETAVVAPEAPVAPGESTAPTEAEPAFASPDPVALPDTRVEAPAHVVQIVEARAAAKAKTDAPAPRGFHDLNKPDPAVLYRQRISGYRVNVVRLLIPAEMKVNVIKDWYGKEIKIAYPRNPYVTWRGVSPDAFKFRHEGVVMEVIPSGTRYVPETLEIVVPHAVTVERR